jgi:hypothetical protein
MIFEKSKKPQTVSLSGGRLVKKSPKISISKNKLKLCQIVDNEFIYRLCKFQQNVFIFEFLAIF